ncbi:hypothetical protein LguiA_019236 [Lonicera macranthoides]
MAINYSIFVFLLCLSFHACNARDRSLGVMMNKDLDEKFLFPNKGLVQNNEKVTLVRNPVPRKSKPISMSNKLEVNENEKNMVEEIRVDEDCKMPTSSKPIQKECIKGKKVAKKQSVSSVEWSVPHVKKGKEQPGFNVDYSPPKTHPPVHN